MNIPQQHYADQFRAANDHLSGRHIPWFQQQRQASLAHFLQTGLPTVRQENWKYTDVSALAKQALTLASQDVQAHAYQQSSQILTAFSDNRLVFINGFYQASLSHITSAALTVTPLATALQHDNGQLQDYFKTQLATTASSFVEFNHAFMQDGVCINLAANAHIEQPIYCLFLNDQTAGSMSHVHNVIHCDRQSQATIIEHYQGLNEEQHLTTQITGLLAAANANINHIKIQQQNRKSYHIHYLLTQLQRDAQVACFNFDFGGKLVRNEVNAQLMEPGANCQLYGLYLVNGRQHTDNHTSISHQAAHTDSHEFYKGIAAERGRAVFNGRVIVQPNAQKINAAQTNNNLLLSSQAEIDTKPQLEIYADDVKCSHGATVGQLDANALFYLQARGIDHATAADILTYGFAQEIVEQLHLPPLNDYLRQQIIQRLAQGESIKELL